MVHSKQFLPLILLESDIKSQRKTGLYFDERMALHAGGKSHPERPDRVNSIWKELEAQDLLSKCIIFGSADQSSRLADEQELNSVHTLEVYYYLMES